jgi:hypothetical protein
MKWNRFREVGNNLSNYDCEDILDAEESTGLGNFSISYVRSLILQKQIKTQKAHLFKSYNSNPKY